LTHGVYLRFIGVKSIRGDGSARVQQKRLYVTASMRSIWVNPNDSPNQTMISALGAKQIET